MEIALILEQDFDDGDHSIGDVIDVRGDAFLLVLLSHQIRGLNPITDATGNSSTESIDMLARAVDAVRISFDVGAVTIRPTHGDFD